MDYRKFGECYYIRMDRDDEIISTILEICKKENIRSATFSGIGGGAQTALAAAGIKLFGGVSGDADEAVEAFINKTLDYNPDVKFSHHEHNHGEGHTCGEHECGSHSCH